MSAIALDQLLTASSAVGSKTLEKAAVKLQVRQPWWNQPIFYVLMTSLTPVCHLLCWLYNVLRAHYSPLVFQYVPIYVDVPHNALEWTLVVCDFIFGQFMLVTIVSFIIVPICDLVLPSKLEWFPHKSNIDLVKSALHGRQEQEQEATEENRMAVNNKKKKNKVERIGRTSLADKNIYSWLLYMYALLQTANMVFSLWMSTGLSIRSFKFYTHAVSLGMTSTASVSISHELFHKILDPVDAFIGKWILNMHMYNHFWIAHVFNHHKDVATPNDPATASRNQSLYSFWPQSSIGGYINAWKVELDMMRRKDIPFWDLERNRMLKYMFINAMTLLTLGLFLGPTTIVTFIIQSIVASFFIEAVNYIEHYGLVRNKMPGSDRYEPVSDLHSWDAPFRLSSFIYLNIMMHSDHHAHPTKEYILLEMKDESPKLPYSYSVMILLSLYPPLFFACVNPILDKFNEQQGMKKKRKRQ